MSKPRYEDLVNQKFNKLTVVEYDHSHPTMGTYWKCQCDCGNRNLVIVSRHNLKGNSVLSCGCLIKEKGLERRSNLLGMTFNQLTVFGSEYDKDKQQMIWLSKCDCGSEKIVRTNGSQLKDGKTKSCGCLRRNRLEFGENGFNRLYDTYRRRAKDNNYEFVFSKDSFREITSKNCFYCGREPFQKAGPTGKGYGYYLYNGIDRIDSSLGYTIENSVPCCGFCNVAKNNYTQNEFFEWIKLVYNNLFGER